jgi:hypothetical protein
MAAAQGLIRIQARFSHNRVFNAIAVGFGTRDGLPAEMGWRRTVATIRMLLQGFT